MFCAVEFKAVMFEVKLTRLELTDRKSEECSEDGGKGSHDSHVTGSHDSHVTANHPLYTGVHPVQCTVYTGCATFVYKVHSSMCVLV